uniref:Rx N-terminal domain-containing protein n=1 Tax=Leersia perrieri TaxID=77586 RepID=A0A0D9X659_9ORYZ
MAIAIPSLDKAISVIQAAIKDEIALQLGLKGDLSFIRDELDMMKAFLMVAEEEREHNEVVKVWTDQINHLALDVEHCLNDNRDRVEKYPRWLFLLTIPARHEIAYTLKELKARVEDVSKRNLRYRLVKDSDSAATLGIKKLLQASSSTTKGSVELVDLCEVIVNEDEELKVMSVWGRDGSDPGKTSVVREAYNSREVRDKFPCRAWVRLAHPFNPNDFLHSLVRQFYGNSLSLEARATVGVGVMRKMEEVIAQGRLAEEFDAHVNDKKYLLVIDDLTTMVEWDWILTYLPDRKKGSKIIVSTQQVEIANLCAAQPCRVAEIKQRLSHRSVYLFFNEVIIILTTTTS